MTAKLHAELEFSVDGMTVNGSGKAVVSLPWLGSEFGIVNFMLAGADLEKRKYPLETEFTCGLQEKINVQLGDGFTGPVAMPTASSVQDAGLSYDQTVAFKEAKPLDPPSLDASRELKLKTVEFSPAQYLKLKQALKAMNYDARKSAILASTSTELEPSLSAASSEPVQSDAEILESTKKLEVTDAHTAVYSGEIRQAHPHLQRQDPRS